MFAIFVAVAAIKTFEKKNYQYTENSTFNFFGLRDALSTAQQFMDLFYQDIVYKWFDTVCSHNLRYIGAGGPFFVHHFSFVPLLMS